MVEILSPDTVRACTYLLTRNEMVMALPAFTVNYQGGGRDEGGEDKEEDSSMEGGTEDKM